MEFHMFFAGSMKILLTFALNLKCETSKPLLWIAFVQIVTLTVAFYDFVSKIYYISRKVRTVFIRLNRLRRI